MLIELISVLFFTALGARVCFFDHMPIAHHLACGGTNSDPVSLEFVFFEKTNFPVKQIVVAFFKEFKLFFKTDCFLKIAVYACGSGKNNGLPLVGGIDLSEIADKILCDSSGIGFLNRKINIGKTRVSEFGPACCSKSGAN